MTLNSISFFNTILFLSADPTDAARLSLGEELREIQEKLQLAKLREKFILHQRMSVRPSDISQALLDLQPNIVHFSGHGTASGMLCFENQDRKLQPIAPEALAALFEQFTNQIACVVLNACYSDAQANAIGQHIEYVIGMNRAIGDKAAIAFSIGFYQGLGAGRSIEDAYKLGCIQIRLQNIPEHSTPVLIKRKSSLQHEITVRDVSNVYSQYIKALRQETDRNFRKPKVFFELTYSAEQTMGIPADNLINVMMSEKRVLLHGPAGSGKTTTLRRLVDHLLNQQIIPVYLDLRNWHTDYSMKLNELTETQQSLISKMEIIFRASSVDLTHSMLSQFPSFPMCIIVDGLNEVYGWETTRQILETLSEYVRQTAPNTSVLVSDRMARRYQPRWLECTIDPVDFSRIPLDIQRKLLGEQIGADKIAVKLLQIPYFLDYALAKENPLLGSTAKALEDFFTGQLGIENDDLDSIASAAFHAYEKHQSLSFPEDFSRDIEKRLWDKLVEAGIIKRADRNFFQFDHQLKHDYLASRYLAQNEDMWSSTTFDILSFKSNSFDGLKMVLEQLTDIEQGDRLIGQIYDWNWPATAACIADHLDTLTRNFSQEIEIFVLAMVSLKLFDPIYGTRQRSRQILAMLKSAKAESFRNARSLDEIIALVENIDSQKKWFLDWKQLFTLTPDHPITENEINQITSRESKIGWTAANVIRRFLLSENDTRHLRVLYHACDEDNVRDNTVRWRIVHALGGCDTTQDVKLLFQALDGDAYLWTRYGAARSLIETAAKTHNSDLRQTIIEQLQLRVATLPPIVQEEIGRAVFYDGAHSEWEIQSAQILQIIRDTQLGQANKEKWDKTLQSLGEFYEKHHDGTPIN